jgi:hypothetical protein
VNNVSCKYNKWRVPASSGLTEAIAERFHTDTARRERTMSEKEPTYYVDMSDAAKIMGISMGRLRVLTKRGDFHPRRSGHMLMYKVDDLKNHKPRKPGAQPIDREKKAARSQKIITNIYESAMNRYLDEAMKVGDEVRIAIPGSQYYVISPPDRERIRQVIEANEDATVVGVTISRPKKSEAYRKLHEE